jgi:hypothetical protein
MFPPFESRLFCLHLKIKKDNSLYVKLDFSIIASLIIKIFYDTFEVIILMLGSLFKINNKFEVLLL